jgi:NAD(P)H-dependent FMN reductase
MTAAPGGKRTPVAAVAVIGSTELGSSSRALAEAALRALAAADIVESDQRTCIEVTEAISTRARAATSPRRRPDPDPVDLVQTAPLLLVASPLARRHDTCPLILRAFLDELDPGALAGTVVIPAVVAGLTGGGSDGHAATWSRLDAVAKDLRRILAGLLATVPVSPLFYRTSADGPDGAARSWVHTNRAAILHALNRPPTPSPENDVANTASNQGDPH